jgi:hypothetical protein
MAVAVTLAISAQRLGETRADGGGSADQEAQVSRASSVGSRSRLTSGTTNGHRLRTLY